MGRFLAWLLSSLLFATAAVAQSPNLPPSTLKGSLPRMAVFVGPVPFPPQYCGYADWFWGSWAGSIASRTPDLTLPRDCVFQLSYVTGYRYQVTLDLDKTPVWFHEQHPDWVQYQPPRPLQGTMNANGTSISDVTYNTSFPIGNYSLASATSFPLGATISSISSDGTTIGMSGVSACTASSSCGEREIILDIAGWASLNLTGTVTDGSADITNVKLDYNGLQSSNGRAGVQGSYLYGNSCLAGGTSVALLGTVFPQEVFLDTPITSGCAGGTQRFVALSEANESSQRPYGNCNGNCLYQPLDITNPKVQDFLLFDCRRSDGTDCSYLSLIKAGFAGLAIDNSHTYNGGAVKYGHFVGAVAPCAKANQPQCGGTLVADYMLTAPWGASQYGDTKFQGDRIKWIQRVRGAVNAAGGIISANTGGPPSGTIEQHKGDLAALAEMGNATDMIAMEHAGAGGCDESGLPKFQAGNYWKNMFYMLSMMTSGIGVVEDTYCGDTVTTPGGAEEQYVMATYMLIAKAGCATGTPRKTCLWYVIAPVSERDDTKNGIVPTYHASWDTDCGSIADAGPAGIGVIVSTDTAYERVLPKCIVGLNPDDTNTATVTLPALPVGHFYTDLFGDPVAAGVVTLNPTVPGATGNALVAIIH